MGCRANAADDKVLLSKGALSASLRIVEVPPKKVQPDQPRSHEGAGALAVVSDDGVRLARCAEEGTKWHTIHRVLKGVANQLQCVENWRQLTALPYGVDTEDEVARRKAISAAVFAKHEHDKAAPSQAPKAIRPAQTIDLKTPRSDAWVDMQGVVSEATDWENAAKVRLYVGALDARLASQPHGPGQVRQPADLRQSHRQG
jgi:HEAT repeat protein